MGKEDRCGRGRLRVVTPCPSLGGPPGQVHRCLAGGRHRVAGSQPAPPAGTPRHPTDLRVHAETILQSAVADVLGDDPDVDVKPSVVEGHPVPVLLNAAKGASLLVVGSRGHGVFTGILLGSVSTHCVTHATCPVTVVRDDSQQEGGDPSLR